MSTLAPTTLSKINFVGRDQLILRSVSLVRRAVGRYTAIRSGALEAEDILSFGTLGLIDAVDRYDHSRGVKFETYACTRIRGYVVDQLRSMDWLPRSARANVSLVRNTAAHLEETLGRKPVLAELAEKTGLPHAACDQALVDNACSLVSLDTIVNGSDECAGSLIDYLEDDTSPNPAVAVERRELNEGVLQALAALPARERDIVRRRYVDEWSYRQIAATMSISESRVIQLHAQGLNRMRRTLLANFP